LTRLSIIFNRYNKIDPNKIRVGDIIEAQVSFVAVPIKDRQFKLLVVLRAITLLDCQPLKVCIHIQIATWQSLIEHRMLTRLELEMLLKISRTRNNQRGGLSDI
jgi:hypothetical protein